MKLTVFTKPWPAMPLPELAEFVKGLGFEGIELPVRPGYQVPPEHVSQKLPEAVRVFADHGLCVHSIAGPIDEPAIAACGEAGVPIIRIMPEIPEGDNYLEAVAAHQRRWDALLPLLQEHGVAIGAQNHCNRWVANAMELRHCVGKYDPKLVCAVWDAGHSGLLGEMLDHALDIVASHLRIVNLKNAAWHNAADPDAGVAQWRIRWVTGREGMTNWETLFRELRKRKYEGPICFSAEYSDHDAVNRLIAEDIRFAKEALGGI